VYVRVCVCVCVILVDEDIVFVIIIMSVILVDVANVCRTNWSVITCSITGSTCPLSALDASVSLSLRCVSGESPLNAFDGKHGTGKYWTTDILVLHNLQQFHNTREQLQCIGQSFLIL